MVEQSREIIPHHWAVRNSPGESGIYIRCEVLAEIEPIVFFRNVNR